MVLVWYAQFLSRSFKSHGSIVSYLTRVKTLHNLLNYRIAGFSGFLLKLTLRGLRLTNNHIVKRARPMTPAILRKLYYCLNHEDPEQAVFWACCLLAFLLLFRKSSLLPTTADGFDGSRQLRHGDCIIDWELRRVVVGIRWSKNHQFTKELLTFPLPELSQSVLCPVKAICKIRSLIPNWNATSHLFQLPDGSSLTYRKFQSMLRHYLEIIGVEQFKHFSSHSFRRGGTTFSFLCGVPTEMIKLLGNWKSDAFLSYLEFPIETCMAACELIRMRLLALESRPPSHH